MIGGLLGSALSTQGGFLGNSAGLAGKYPLGLAGQIGGLNNQISPQEEEEGGNPLGIGGLVGQMLPQAEGGNFFGSGTSFGVGGLVGQMLPPIDPAAHRNQMRQKKIYDKGSGTNNPNEADAFLRRTGAQLPPLAQGLPNGEQGPSQGPNTPVRNYPGMGYGPVGPMGGGLPPTPMASMYGGPQMGQAGGLLGNANFFNDPMTIKRVS